jgi:hypothetical protein
MPDAPKKDYSVMLPHGAAARHRVHFRVAHTGRRLAGHRIGSSKQRRVGTVDISRRDGVPLMSDEDRNGRRSERPPPESRWYCPRLHTPPLDRA